MSNAYSRLLLLTFSLSAFSSAANALWSEDCRSVTFPSTMSAASTNCDMITAEVASLSQFMPPAPFISTIGGFQAIYPDTGLFPSTLPSFSGGVPWGTGNANGSGTGHGNGDGSYPFSHLPGWTSPGNTSQGSSANSSTGSSNNTAPSTWQ